MESHSKTSQKWYETYRKENPHIFESFDKTQCLLIEEKPPAPLFDTTNLPNDLNHPGASYLRKHGDNFLIQYPEMSTTQNGNEPEPSQENEPLFPFAISHSIEPFKIISPATAQNKTDNFKVLTVNIGQVTPLDKVVEPLIFSFFLWSKNYKEKFSETWRYIAKETIPQGLQIQPLVIQPILDAPPQFSIPIFPTSYETYLICVVERLMIKDGGDKVETFYTKMTERSRKDALNDVMSCKIPYVMQTFAFSYAPLKSDLLKDFVFSSFVPTSTADNDFLNHFIDPSNTAKPKKIYPFTLPITSTLDATNAYLLDDYYPPKTITPSHSFTNKLRIQLLHAKIKHTKKEPVRNLLIEIKLISNGNYIPIYKGEYSYRSRIQYHVCDPHFFDDIVIKLPTNLSKDAVLVFDCFHVAVKPNTKSSMLDRGSCRLPLFRDDCFVPNGEQKLVVKRKGASSDEGENFLLISLTLKSSIYSQSKFVTAIYEGDMVKAQKMYQGGSDQRIRDFEKDKLTVHLIPALNVLFEKINDNDFESFKTLLALLDHYKSYEDQTASDFLRKYIQNVALADPSYKDFHVKLLNLWKIYIQKTPMDKRTLENYSRWFLLNCIIKSMLKSSDKIDDPKSDLVKLSISLIKALEYYRTNLQIVGQSLVSSLSQLCRHLFTLNKPQMMLVILSNLLKQIKLEIIYEAKQQASQESKTENGKQYFLSLFNSFFTKEIFAYCVLNGIFQAYFVPLIMYNFEDQIHSQQVFNKINSILLLFNRDELKLLAHSLFPLLDQFGTFPLETYKNKQLLIDFFIFIHYLIFYNSEKSLSHLSLNLVKQILILRKGNIRPNSPEKLALDDFAIVARPKNATPKKRTFSQRISGTLPRNYGQSVKATEPREDKISPSNLSLYTQHLCLELLAHNDSIDAFNLIITTMITLPMADALQEPFYKKATDFVKRNSKILFDSKDADIYHQIKFIFQHPSPSSLKYVQTLVELDDSKQLINALICRSLYRITKQKKTLPDEFIEEIEGLSFSDTAKQLKEFIDQTSEMYEIQAERIYQESELLKASPDTRVKVLLELADYNEKKAYKVESVQAMLYAATCVAEYMTKLEKLPLDLFNEQHKPYLNFLDACPSAASMRFDGYDKAAIGYCESKYFTEFGLIYLINETRKRCKKFLLLQYITKLQDLLSPLVLYRRLWSIVGTQYFDGKIVWNSLESQQLEDQSFGEYYKVEFENKDVYIYRESQSPNVWKLKEDMPKTHKEMAHGKPIEVLNEGDGLTGDLKEDKFYIHVKSVKPYFDENDDRKTKFEMNHNVEKFYYQVPLKRPAKTELESIWLKRTIFKLPHPMPFVLKRVKIPAENITVDEMSPIRKGLQDMQAQNERLRDAIKVGNINELAPLLQGILLTTVNAGPVEIARTFLSSSKNGEVEAKLRKVFVEMIDLCSVGVHLHWEYAKNHVQHKDLNEFMQEGLKKFSSVIQQYLK